jgi:hypothetical protein
LKSQVWAEKKVTDQPHWGKSSDENGLATDRDMIMGISKQWLMVSRLVDSF